MRSVENSEIYNFNKSTYVNLRWIAFIGQIFSIFFVEFILRFKFNYIPCLIVIFLGVLTNIFLQFKIKDNQISNTQSLKYLIYDILQLTFLFFLTGGITNPFIFLIIIPAVFSSQYLSIKSSVILVILTVLVLILLTFYYLKLPHPSELHFHVPNYYLYAIPVSILIGLLFLVYFAVQFGEQNRKRKKAFDKIQEIMAKENELLSLGGQAAAAAHSLNTPLSTIKVISQDMYSQFKEQKDIKKDIELLVSQVERCSQILKKLTLNPIQEDDFINQELSISEYIAEIIKSFREISDKEFLINLSQDSNSFRISKIIEIVYGIRNFIGNANKFAKSKIYVSVKSNNEITEISIEDDGDGYPKDILNKIGEPYIKSTSNKEISKSGLGLGIFIGKTLLERNKAKVICRNSKTRPGAEVIITWKNNFLKSI